MAPELHAHGAISASKALASASPGARARSRARTSRPPGAARAPAAPGADEGEIALSGIGAPRSRRPARALPSPVPVARSRRPKSAADAASGRPSAHRKCLWSYSESRAIDGGDRSGNVIGRLSGSAVSGRSHGVGRPGPEADVGHEVDRGDDGQSVVRDLGECPRVIPGLVRVTPSPRADVREVSVLLRVAEPRLRRARSAGSSHDVRRGSNHAHARRQVAQPQALP